MLRESINSLGRAHIGILTRYDDSSPAIANQTVLRKRFPHLSIFKALHKADAVIVENKEINPGILHNKRLVVFSGLADNDQFLTMVCELGAKVTHFAQFKDHRNYNDRDIDFLIQTKKNTAADGFLTTEKDLVKVDGFKGARFDPWALRIRFQIIENEESFFRMLPYAVV